MLYHEHKEQWSKEFSNLIDSVDGFYAFGEDQLSKAMKERGLTRKSELVSLTGFGGLIIPKSKKTRFENEYLLFTERNKKRTQELESNEEELRKAIIYEINNFECLYTYDLTEVYSIFPRHKKMVLEEYKKLEQKNFS